MEKSIIVKGKTIDIAVTNALEQLGMERDNVSVEVLENPRSGFFGIGAVPATIKVSYNEEDPEETPKAALSSASRNLPKKKVPKTAETDAVKPQKQEKEQSNKEPVKQATERPEQMKPEQKEKAEPVEQKPLPEYKVPEAGSAEEKTETFIKGLLEHMEATAVPKAYRIDEDTILCNLEGGSLGMLIGRRGDTLDAIQHLTNYVVNKDGGKRVRINVDAENYRAKREESLQRLAGKVAAKVQKYKKSVTLEPMNAYERHVIHAAIQDMPNVYTHSTGTEPNRRVVVSYDRGNRGNKMD